VVRNLVYNPRIWVEDADDCAGAEPRGALLKSVAGSGRRPSTAARTAEVPADRPTLGSDPGWRLLLATMEAELAAGTADPPSFPGAVINIHTAFNAPGTSIEDLVKLIQSEPRLADLLVVLANASLFGTGAGRVTDLRHAVSRLGKPIIRGAAVAFAVQRMKEELRLRSIAAPLIELWRTSLAVACISQVVARRTKVKSEEAFLTGLLHGIGYLYIMARSVGKSTALGADLLGNELIDKSHPSIGRAALGTWGAGEAMKMAVKDQRVLERPVRSREHADATDVLIVSIALAAALKDPEPREVAVDRASAFRTLDMTAEDCAKTLKHAEYQLASLHLLDV